MSLTSALRNDKVLREKFKEEFSKPSFKVDEDLVSPPRTKNYRLVGTAFDYLVRFYIERINPNAKTEGKWTADHALILLKNSSLRRSVEQILATAKKRYKTYLNTGKITDQLIESAISLARLEPIVRSGHGREHIGKPMDKNDIKDLYTLIKNVPDDLFRAENICLINPTFGMASSLVGGADADLFIDNTIIDIKTTKNLTLERRYFDQLVGYYTLHKIESIGKLDPKPDINKVGIYYSRHSYLHILHLDQIIDDKTFPKFAKWFKKHFENKRSKRINPK